MLDKSHKSSQELDIQFEYRTTDTVQQNHLAELGFTAIALRARTMMIHVNLDWD